MEAQTTENVFANFLSACGACKESLQSRDPKLLPCLHTFCKQCVLTECVSSEKANTIRCMTCKLECRPSDVIDNQFDQLNNVLTPTEAAPSAEEGKICTGCEENTTVTSFCLECSEWLCDGCVQAHRRVRITKDHTIQPRDSVGQTESNKQSADRLLYCPTHKHEQLKLFCETCDRLTCRDCQLVEHKDHKYQFVTEAALQYKQFLHTLIGKLKEKQVYVENAKSLINRRYQEIDRKEKLVTNDIKTFAIKLITEINRRGKKLLTDLNSVCGTKMRQLGAKHSEILGLSSRLDHVLKFAEFALDHKDSSAILHAKKLLVGQLKHVLRTRCEVPNPYHVVDIRLKYDEAFLMNALSRQGTLVVEGVPYSLPSSTVTAPGQASQVGQQQQQQQPSQQQRASHSGAQPSTASATGQRRMPSLQNLTPEQRGMLMKRLTMYAQSGATAGTSGTSSAFGSRSSSSSGPSLAHYPAQQSSMVSSSNNHAKGSVFLAPGSSTSRPPMSQAQGLINLAQLRQQRLQRSLHQQHQHQHQRQAQQMPNMSQQPIVIQPTSPPASVTGPPPYPGNNASSTAANTAAALGNTRTLSPNPRQTSPGSQGSGGVSPIEILPNLPICVEAESRSTFRNVDSSSCKQEQMERPSCSFPGTSVKKEQQNDLVPSIVLNANDLNFDEDPASLLESIKRETDNLIPQMSLDYSVSNSDGSGDNGGMNQVDINNIAQGDLGLLNLNDHQILGTCEFLNLSNESGGEGMSENGTGDGSGPHTPVASKNIGNSSHPTEASGSTQQSDDPSEDYCAVCHNGGDLLCCDNCPRVFHLNCHVPSLAAAPSGLWQCNLCRKEEELVLSVPDARPEDAVAVGSKRKMPVGLTDKELLVCERILLELFAHEASIPFHEPVPKSVPNYHKIIAVPMDFTTIKTKLSRQHFNHYRSIEDFCSDVQLVFTNCSIFNSSLQWLAQGLPQQAFRGTPRHTEGGQSVSEVGRTGKLVERFFEELLLQFVPYLDLRSATPTSDSSNRSVGRKKARKNDKIDELAANLAKNATSASLIVDASSDMSGNSHGNAALTDTNSKVTINGTAANDDASPLTDTVTNDKSPVAMDTSPPQDGASNGPSPPLDVTTSSDSSAAVNDSSKPVHSS